MKNDGTAGAGYVDKARDQMQTYVRGLLSENETLRVCLVEIESETSNLRQEIRSLRDELGVSRTLQEQLMSKLQEIRGESERRFAEYSKLEVVNANLANLYVASYQLHSTLHRETVLAAIQEIVINLIGSEEFAIFERQEDGGYQRIGSMGIDDNEPIDSHERVAHVTSTGETWVSAHHGDMAACVPLKIDGKVTGFIVIRRLLAHKASLEPLDLELFDLLATHAAMALYASSLKERFVDAELVASR